MKELYERTCKCRQAVYTLFNIVNNNESKLN